MAQGPPQGHPWHPLEFAPVDVDRELRVVASTVARDPIDRMIQRRAEVREEVANEDAEAWRKLATMLARHLNPHGADEGRPRWDERLADLRVTLRDDSVAFSVREGSDLLVKGVQMLFRSVELKSSAR